MCAEVPKSYSKNDSVIHEIVEKEKEICAHVADTLQTAKAVSTVLGKCLPKMEKALHLWVEDMNRRWVLTEGRRQ